MCYPDTKKVNSEWIESNAAASIVYRLFLSVSFRTLGRRLPEITAADGPESPTSDS